MKKIIKKIGDSIGLIFDREERTIFDLEVGDIIDIEIKKVKEGEDGI